MNRADVIARIRAVEPALRARGVAALYLYGSHARDEARPDSDIDILVEFVPEQEGGISAYLAPYHVLEEQFPGKDIGYGTREEIVSHYRPHIERSAIRVF
jgi:predicted nucleotidyltransferase